MPTKWTPGSRVNECAGMPNEQTVHDLNVWLHCLSAARIQNCTTQLISPFVNRGHFLAWAASSWKTVQLQEFVLGNTIPSENKEAHSCPITNGLINDAPYQCITPILLPCFGKTRKTSYCVCCACWKLPCIMPLGNPWQSSAVVLSLITWQENY